MNLIKLTDGKITLIDKKSKKMKIGNMEKRGLKNAVLELTINLIKTHNLDENLIKGIIASGMITSNLGVCQTTYVTTPASINDIVRNTERKYYKQTSNIPWFFTPGVENQNKNADEINIFDVMRGEEVESLGLLKTTNKKGKGLFVLPGSHTKFIFVEDDIILKSATSIAGELIEAISVQTVLRSSIERKLIEKIDSDYLYEGYNASEKYGFTRSLFHIRLFDLYKDLSPNARANYLVGIIINNDLKVLENMELNKLDWILVGGTNVLQKAYTKVLKNFWNIDVEEVNEKDSEESVMIGAVEVIKSLLHGIKGEINENN